MPFPSSLKAIVPAAVRSAIRRRREDADHRAVRKAWDRAIPMLRPRPVERPLKRLLILPSDPWTLTGALGDDAMIMSCVGIARALNPAVDVHVITASPEASREAAARGLKAEEIWTDPDYPVALAGWLERTRFDAAAALGADIMDGYYSPVATTKVLATCDLAGRSGVPTTILGFSFNSKASQELRPDFQRVHGAVRFHPRDALSMERFTAFTGRSAVQVADSAFVLVPEPPEPGIAGWIAARRAEGRRVIGVNVHPMLIREATADDVAAIIRRTVEALEAVAQRHAVAFLALPHDYRGDRGDERCLAPIAAELAAGSGTAVRLLEGRHPAATLKGVAGSLDAVITGRMHLAVASLGMGVPTLCVTYQDKFEGLYRHFDLPEWLLLSPEAFLAEGVFLERLDRMLRDLDGLSMQIRDRLPGVVALSRANFSVFEEAAPAASEGPSPA